MITLEKGILYNEPIPIGNAVNLHIIHTEKFKTAVCCLLIRRPLSRDDATKNALLPGVLRQGCAKYPSIPRINSRMEELFGSVFDCQTVKKGEEQILQLYFEGIPGGGNFTKGVEFLTELMLNPLMDGGGFKAEIVDNAKNNLRNNIEGRMNNKAEYARVNCLAAMCGDEPFGVFADGYSEDLDAYTPETLYRYYREILRTSPIEIICAGNVGEEELIAAARGLDIQDRRPITIPSARCIPARADVQYASGDLNGSQGKICVGLRSDITPVSRLFFGLLMMNEILGGGPSSKLFTKLREKESLCYYINSTLYRFKSIILIQAGVAAADFERVTDLANREIEEIRQECVTRGEWVTARRNLIMKMKGGQDYYSSVLDFYAAQCLLNDPKPIEDFIKGVETISRDEMVEAARRVRLDTVYVLK
jgi:predicted Zn-dependent peptidase